MTNNTFKGVFFCLLFWSLAHFKYVSFRPSLAGLRELDVCAFFDMPCELNNCLILLPEGIAQFRVSRSYPRQPDVQVSVPSVPRAAQLHARSPPAMHSITLPSLNIADIQRRGHCFVMQPPCCEAHLYHKPSEFGKFHMEKQPCKK